MSTTTAGSQGSQASDEAHSQKQTFDPYHLHVNYPDRQDDVLSSEHSFVQSSLDVQLTQLSPPASQLSNASRVSATPSLQSVSATPSPLSDEDSVRKHIEEMNKHFERHGYQAFVHKDMHIIIKRYPFNLTPKW